eukprot:COSAG02_NODE_871_length_16337_cov_7.124276_5_plen_105_part_00
MCLHACLGGWHRRTAKLVVAGHACHGLGRLASGGDGTAVECHWLLAIGGSQHAHPVVGTPGGVEGWGVPLAGDGLAARTVTEEPSDISLSAACWNGHQTVWRMP